MDWHVVHRGSDRRGDSLANSLYFAGREDPNCYHCDVTHAWTWCCCRRFGYPGVLQQKHERGATVRCRVGLFRTAVQLEARTANMRDRKGERIGERKV